MQIVHPLSSWLAVIAIINGCMGGTILLMPVLALKSGWLVGLLSTLIIAIGDCYTSYLTLLHMGDQTDFDNTLLVHFGNSPSIKRTYNIINWLSIMCWEIYYFSLIILQWQSLIPPHHFSPLSVVLNGIALILITLFLKRFEFSSHFMGYGFATIVAFLVFIVYNLASAPSGSGHVPVVVGGWTTYMGIMQGALLAQYLLIPIIKRHPHPQNYYKILMAAFLFMPFAYSFASIAGSLGIVNRQPSGDSRLDETIFGFFAGSWESSLLQVMFLIHLYTVMPQYFVVSLKRFFGICDLEQSGQLGLNLTEVVYTVAIIALIMLISLSGVDLNKIVTISGSIFGFFMIYIFPIGIHIKCLFWPEGKVLVREEELGSKWEQVNQEEQLACYRCCASPPQGTKGTLILVGNVLLVGFGMFIMGSTLVNLASE